MALSIQARFGENATLSNGILQIEISDLISTGLDSTSPTADQLLAALILLSQANQPDGADLDPSVGVVVADGFDSLTDRGEVRHLQYQKILSLFVPDPTPAFDPDAIVG